MGARGDYTAPLSEEEINAKFTALVGGRIGAGKAAQLKDLIDEFEHHDSSELLAFL